ncbi:hypothetical protein D3C71_1568320 [compost metagenome]
MDQAESRSRAVGADFPLVRENDKSFLSVLRGTVMEILHRLIDRRQFAVGFRLFAEDFGESLRILLEGLHVLRIVYRYIQSRRNLAQLGVCLLLPSRDNDELRREAVDFLKIGLLQTSDILVFGILVFRQVGRNVGFGQRLDFYPQLVQRIQCTKVEYNHILGILLDRNFSKCMCVSQFGRFCACLGRSRRSG